MLVCKRGASADLPLGAHDTAGRQHVAFAIPASDLELWESRLLQHGVTIEETRHWGRGGVSLYFRDPDGHLIELATPGVWPHLLTYANARLVPWFSRSRPQAVGRLRHRDRRSRRCSLSTLLIFKSAPGSHPRRNAATSCRRRPIPVYWDGTFRSIDGGSELTIRLDRVTGDAPNETNSPWARIEAVTLKIPDSASNTLVYARIRQALGTPEVRCYHAVPNTRWHQSGIWPAAQGRGVLLFTSRVPTTPPRARRMLPPSAAGGSPSVRAGQSSTLLATRKRAADDARASRRLSGSMRKAERSTRPAMSCAPNACTLRPSPWSHSGRPLFTISVSSTGTKGAGRSRWSSIGGRPSWPSMTWVRGGIAASPPPRSAAGPRRAWHGRTAASRIRAAPILPTTASAGSRSGSIPTATAKWCGAHGSIPRARG